MLLRAWLLIIISLFIAGPWQSATASPIVISQLSPTAVRLDKRAVTAPICATVTLNIPVQVKLVLTVTINVPLANICLCATTDGLTLGSLDTLTNAVTGGILGTLGLTTAALNTLINTVIKDAVIASLSGKPATCTGSNAYPANAIPNSCTACTYSCKAGYTKCNNGQCALTCSTAAAKRSLASRSKFICPLTREACLASRGTIKVDAVFSLKNVECLDVKSNLFSCGGCLTPFPGRPQGRDCTQLPHVDDVSCFQGGCKVDSCERGFAPNRKRTACVPFGEAYEPPPSAKTSKVLVPRGEKIDKETNRTLVGPS